MQSTFSILEATKKYPNLPEIPPYFMTYVGMDAVICKRIKQAKAGLMTFLCESKREHRPSSQTETSPCPIIDCSEN